MARGLRAKNRGGIPSIHHVKLQPFLEWLRAMRYKDCRSSLSGSEPGGYNVPSYQIDFETMAPDAQRQKRRDFVLSSLNVAIEASNLAKEFCSITPAKPVFGSLNIILTMIKVDLFLHCLCRLIGG
jgi:hypothetical protein